MGDLAKATFAFSKLTEINRKRSERYTAAAEKIKNIHLKIVFMNYAFQAQQLNADLGRWISAYGVQTLQNHHSILSTAWEKIKDIFGSYTETGIFSACEQLEEEAIKNYRTALILSFLPDAALKDVERQFKEIQKIKDNLHTMKQSHAYEWQAA
ncbi:MAG TPA: PA2169 family four-helix-bundle protein [Cyclobacteriaceae bacterium]|nr:PA2169 family four-helix-bundle protein [Cyclobacteriaceae bacterium]